MFEQVELFLEEDPSCLVSHGKKDHGPLFDAIWGAESILAM
jgi:hypothetical protein